MSFSNKKPELFYTPSENFLPPVKYHTSRPIEYKSMHMETPGMKIDVQSIMMSNWFEEEEHNTDLPYMPQEILKLIHNFGYSMLLDDKHDIGKFSYARRPGYPDHPSGIHHWYIGAGLMTLAQLGGMVQKMKEFMEVGATMGLNELAGLMGPELSAESAKPLPPIKVYGQPIPNTHLPSLPNRLPPLQQQTKSMPILPAPKQQSRSQVPNPLKGLSKC